MRPSCLPRTIVSANRVAIAEQAGGLGDLAFAEQRADAARRDDLGALVAEGVDQRHAEAVPFARRHQERRAALPVLAEVEIESGDGMADAETALQYAGHELLGALAGEFAR